MGSFLGPRIRHDLGKMMFAFVMIWAYVNFSQYLIVWSGNIPEEIHWYLARFRGGWGAIGLVILLFHFVLPFMLLLSREANRNPRLLAAGGGAARRHALPGHRLARPARLLRGQVLDPLDRPHPAGRARRPWLAFFARNLASRPLLPEHDPGFEEAVAHGRE